MEKTVYINSYYSEIDYSDVNNSGVDGFYEVRYLDSVDLKKEIEECYQKKVDDGELVISSLEIVLEDLLEQNKILYYKMWNCLKFDCDYGYFKE